MKLMYEKKNHTKFLLKDQVTIPTFEAMLDQVRNLTNLEATSEVIMGRKRTNVVDINIFYSTSKCWHCMKLGHSWRMCTVPASKLGCISSGVNEHYMKGSMLCIKSAPMGSRAMSLAG